MRATRSRSLRVLALSLAALGCQSNPGAATSGPATTPPTAITPAAASATPAASAPPAASATAAATAAPVATTTPTELAARAVPVMNAAMPSGRYTSSAVTPRITFEVENLAWFAGPQTDGFFAVVRGAGGPDIVIVRFIRPTAINTGPDSTVDASTAAAAIEALQANPAFVDLGSSDSLIGGLSGTVIELEAASDDAPSLFAVGAVKFVVEPGLRGWVAFFDTPDGLLAVMVQGSAAAWERDLGLAEPLLETVTIGR